jgi:hypothetical protein
MSAAETSTATATRPPTHCSRVTNGKTLFAVGGDMRSAWARRLCDVLDLHLSDLGGADAASEAMKSIVRRAAVLTVELERLETRFSEAGATADDLDLYQRTAGNLRRLLECVGMERRPRDVTPDINTYLKRKTETAGSAQAAAHVRGVEPAPRAAGLLDGPATAIAGLP